MKTNGIILICLLNMLAECYAECSTDMAEMTSSGTISSPNYPDDYDNDLDCTYIIQSPTGKPITLVFVYFDLGLLTTNCSFDYVQLQDGRDDSVVDLGKVCGKTLPDPILALSGTLIVKFHSNSVWPSRGFQAVYNDSHDCTQIRKECCGKITSPNFPEGYPDNALCMYYIQNTQGLSMKITFTSFDTESSRFCRHDQILVKDNVKISAKSYGPFCGDNLPVIPIINTGILFIVFVSDQRFTRSGFSATIDYALDCSGHLNFSHGIIQSPNYPKWYDDNTDCTYRLSNVNNNPINLTFTEFWLETSSENCENDFVEIRTNEEVPEKFCGSYKIPFYRIIASNSSIRFHSDDQTTRKGFFALFSEITEPILISGQYSRSTTTTSSYKEAVSQSGGLTTEKEELSISEISTPLLLEGRTKGETLVPIITGIVAGVVVFTVLIVILVFWFLRKSPSCKKHQHTARSNKNYIIRYNSAPEADNFALPNGEAEYCDVDNERSNAYIVVPDYDVAAEIPEKQTDALSNVSGEPEGDYVDQDDSYNILNVHPKKSGTTELYDRTTEGVYDSAAQERGVSDIGLYDQTANSPDHEYDSTLNVKPEIEGVYN